MNIIELSPDCAVKLNGGHYDLNQLEAIVDAAWQLCFAYARADEANGGGGSVDWEHVDGARDDALQGFGDEAKKDLNAQAAAWNGQGTNDAKEAPPYEFKRAEDTEGGTCD
jgi:hypothetical protein